MGGWEGGGGSGGSALPTARSAYDNTGKPLIL